MIVFLYLLVFACGVEPKNIVKFSVQCFE